jgi:hypothetical protein
MEPHREEPKAPKLRPEKKHTRFRIVKLEERIAPGVPPDTHNCHYTHKCTGGCSLVCTGLSIE